MRFSTKAAYAFASCTCLFANPASAGGALRAEAVVGWDRVAQEINSPVANVISPNKVNGAVYGGAIGYDLAVAPILTIGADAEITGSTGRYNFGSSNFRIGRDLYAGGRVSLKVLPSTRIYAKLGYANANFTSQGAFFLHGSVLPEVVPESWTGC